MAELTCQNIACTEDALIELSDGQPLVRVAIRDIKEVALSHGFQSPHPVLQIVFGSCLAVVGLTGVGYVLNIFFRKGVFFIGLSMLSIPGCLGIWLIVTALHRGFYLDVRTMAGRKRLAFEKDPTSEELRVFLKEVEKVIGTPIQRWVPV